MVRSITSSRFLAAWALAASTACASAPCAVDGDGGTWPGDAATGAGDAPVAAPALDAWQPDAWQPDAPARAEVRYFALHPAGIRFVHVDRCPTTNAESLMVRMRVLLTSTCESPGPVGARRLAPGRWDVEALVWREHGTVSCESVSDGYEVDVPVRLDAGPQELGVGDSRFVFEVAEHPPDVCPARGTLPDGTACDQDCECTPGSRCLAARDAGCARTCAQPCAVDPTGDTPACGSGATCALDERLGAFVCAPSAAPECDAMRPCGRGQSCELSGRCTWSLPASPSDGSCTSSADCPTGEDCVLRWDHTLRCGLRCGPAGRCPAGACDLDGSCDYGD